MLDVRASWLNTCGNACAASRPLSAFRSTRTAASSSAASSRCSLRVPDARKSIAGKNRLSALARSSVSSALPVLLYSS